MVILGYIMPDIYIFAGRMSILESAIVTSDTDDIPTNHFNDWAADETILVSYYIASIQNPDDVLTGDAPIVSLHTQNFHIAHFYTKQLAS